MSYHTLIHLSRSTAFALALFLCTSCTTWHRAPDTAELGTLMVKRLGWMDEVARVKQAKKLPITDAKREAEVLRSMEQQGAAAGLPAMALHDFFAGQMEAARLRQAEWLKAHPHLIHMAAPSDLSKTVRPALDEIGKDMIRALSRARALPDKTPVITNAQERLAAAGYSKAVSAAALRGLEKGLKP